GSPKGPIGQHAKTTAGMPSLEMILSIIRKEISGNDEPPDFKASRDGIP
nr:hypothetical protein [Bacteroidota bacterium]